MGYLAKTLSRKQAGATQRTFTAFPPQALIIHDALRPLYPPPGFAPGHSLRAALPLARQGRRVRAAEPQHWLRLHRVATLCISRRSRRRRCGCDCLRARPARDVVLPPGRRGEGYCNHGGGRGLGFNSLPRGRVCLGWMKRTMRTQSRW